ncbi:uncharacterized protein LOC130649014 isoform X1 [Hydractinia symbiolongicarpus]|uniref:uncharacterized protein LOC130649014 isoform X1 n=1 Tax=Hydractinia symbiolongicarpus TaxID=13093 RepID=UPI00254CAFE8|nr:uncharacterized protein LOC130649014 isoform X1 [Hydractinia symbiolongicarpus]
MTTQQPTIVNSALRTKRLRIISKLGNVLIIAGVLTFGFSVSMYGALRIKDVPINQHHTSLIASFWIIATGILAVCTRPKSQGRGLVGTFNAFAITSIILAFLAFGTSVAGVVMYAKCGRRSPKNCRKSPDYGNVVYALLLALHLLEMAISIAATVYGFKVYNCCSHRSGQESNAQMFQATSRDTVFQNTMAPQPQQNQTLVTSTSGEQFILTPVRSMSQRPPIGPPVPGTTENGYAALQYSYNNF